MIAEAQTERAPSRDRHSLGIWLEQESNHGPRGQTAEHVLRKSKVHALSQPSNAYAAIGPPDSRPILPDRSDQLALVDVYFSRLHPVLPILDEDQFRKEVSAGSHSPILMQAVCLSISNDARASSHLRLVGVSPSTLTSLQFSSCLHDELKMAVTLRREDNRIRLIQSLALLSLHVESGPYGVEDASMYLAQAIHHAQTIALHLGRSKGHRQSYEKLFWCLWCLSKLNAASTGRPRIMSDADIGLKIDDVLEFCHPAFKIMITISQLLDRVIKLYQPTSDPQIIGIDDAFPSFEIVVNQHEGWSIEASMLTSLELFYHGVSILAYRTRSTDDVELAEPTPSSLRQALSAQQVMRILQHTPLQALLPLPIVPYAISLALSQTYRQFRRSRSATKRAIAQEQLECYVHALEGLSKNSQSALTMAAIGRRVLSQIQRLNNQATRRTAETSDALQAFFTRQETQEVSKGSVVGNAPATPNIQQNDAGAPVYGDTDAFAGFDDIFLEDDTLQAMDTVFDTFMGLDYPHELFNDSLADDAFGSTFISG